MDDRYTIDTPENIEFGYDIAGIGSRMLAAIVDTVAIAIAEAIVLFAGGVAVRSLGIAENLLTAVGILVGFVILWGYYIAFEMLWNGQSLGKRLLGLRVVREGGRPITFTASAIRNLVRFVDFLPIVYGIGVVVMFIDTRARRLGDLAAGVVVVRERSEVTLASLVATSAALLATDATIDAEPFPGISLLREVDYRLVQEFLDQRLSLGREARARLAGQLVQGLEVRLSMAAEVAPEVFLEHVARAYRAHQAAQVQSVTSEVDV